MEVIYTKFFLLFKMFNFPVIIALLTIFILSNLKKFKNWWFERKRKNELGEMIPGPKSLPIIGNALMFFGSLEKVEKMFYEQDQIGFKNDEPLRRFWIGNLLIVHALSPEASKVILESKTETYKGIGYDFFYDWLGSGLITSDGDKWKQRKKLIAPSFSFNMLKKYFEIFNKESKAIVERYEVFAKSGEEVEILETIKRAALDILCGLFVLFFNI